MAANLEHVAEARTLVDVTSRRRLDFLRFTEWQADYLQDDAPAVLVRGGNQIGKTIAKHAEIIHRCRGTHPFKRTHRPPINALVLSESWEQMGQAGGYMEKLWELLPKDEIDPKIRFEPGRGITGKPPRVVFTDGPGAGSVITFGTYRQGAARVAGSTVHFVDLDEPGPESVLHEVMPRLLRHGGHIRIGFTPVLNMPDQRWLRQLVEAGEIVEHNPWLEERSCHPRGNPAPWLAQADIDRVARSWPEAIRSMRIEGAWDPVLTHKWLTNFDRSKHIRPERPPGGAYLGVGIDHGANAGKQAAVLVAVVDRTELSPYVFVIDEAIGDGMSTPSQDARSIHELLERNGFSWRDVDEWVGDRPTGENRYLIRKSNTQLRKHLAYQAKVTVREFPTIRTPKKWWGSVEHGLHLLNALAGTFDDDRTPHLFISPAAERFADFCDNFAGDRRDPLKDVGDAGRYIIERAVRDVPSMRLVARY